TTLFRSPRAFEDATKELALVRAQRFRLRRRQPGGHVEELELRALGGPGDGDFSGCRLGWHAEILQLLPLHVPEQHPPRVRLQSDEARLLRRRGEAAP